MDEPRKSPLARVRSAQEPAALMRRPSSARRGRGWEQSHRAYAYRIDPELNEAMKAAVAEYAETGWITSMSQVAEAWLQAGREAWQRGEVAVNGKDAPQSGSRERTNAGSGV
jgi:hypothetical protein